MKRMKVSVWQTCLPVILLCSLVAGAAPMPAKVIGVVSGDVITVQDEGGARAVRLYGVACPESGQPFADEAKALVTAKALNQSVTLEQMATDSAGWKVVMLVLPNGENLNQMLVSLGLAWWDNVHAPKDATLRGLNAKAIAAKSGLWAQNAPLAPWDYRASHKLKEVAYTVGPAPEVKPAEAPKKDAAKSVSAKGNETYTGGGRVINLKDIQVDKELTEQDALALLATHLPTVSMDANGKPRGLAVPNISELPYASALGFQNGDIVSSVNGEVLTGYDQIMPLYEKLKNSQQVTIQVIRNGQPVNITLNLK
jgi:micrococcal nuclease